MALDQILEELDQLVAVADHGRKLALA